MKVLVIRRPLDLFVKPAVIVAVVLVTELTIRWLFFGLDGVAILPELFVTALVDTPFVVFAVLLATQLQAMQDRLTRHATIDMLTGLPNRRAFFADAGRAVLSSHNGYLLIFDADHFKSINDRYGHAFGDECLRRIGQHLRDHLRETDPFGRIGGEEFAAFLPHRSKEQLASIKLALLRPIHVVDPKYEADVNLTLSIGATTTHYKEPMEAALQRADEALYAAKAAGRHRMCLHLRPRKTHHGYQGIAAESASCRVMSHPPSEDYREIRRAQ